jgi:ribosomal protein L7/L12
MIRKLSVPEILEAIRTLDAVERAAVIAALENQRGVAANATSVAQEQQWAAVAAAGLSRAYGDDEPEYCEADLLP